MSRRTAVLSLAAGAALLAVSDPAVADVLEGAALPRHLTPAEKAQVTALPILAPRSIASPPPGPIVCPPEYAPAEGIMIAWEGPGSWKIVLRDMVVAITAGGHGTVYVVVDSAAEQTSTASTLSSAGADMSRVEFVVRVTDSIWIRDYGPRFIYEGGVRSIVDHTYNRPRPNDNAMTSFFGPQQNHLVYDIPLVHGGGNYHLFGDGNGYATDLIEDENPGLTEAQIIQLWQDYQNLATTLTGAFPIFIDATQHIDMWMIPVSDTTVIVSDWPNNPGSTQDVICDQFASDMASAGKTVFRVPAFSVGGVHYTYTNAVIVNDIALVPSYTQASVAPSNAVALATWQAALPGKTITQIPAQNIVSAAGVLHCIVKHVPTNTNGTRPTAYLRGPRGGGETYDPGESVTIEWISDDDVAVTSVDLELSLDGGVTFPTTIASAQPESGTFDWTVPEVFSTKAVVRVVASDAGANTGESAGDGLFTIAGPPPCAGDVDGDNDTDLGDFTDLAANFGASGLPHGSGESRSHGDLEDDGDVDLGDFTVLAADFGCSS
jgi:agmatine deiminase